MQIIRLEPEKSDKGLKSAAYKVPHEQMKLFCFLALNENLSKETMEET